MRKLMLSLALGVLALPAYAAPADQQHGLGSGMIVMRYTGEVLPGQADAFKAVAAKVIAAVAEEPGTLMYEWSMRPDGKTWDAVEMYRDSAAVVAHVKDVGSKFGKELGQVQKEVRFYVYGSPDDQAKSTLAPLNPIYTTRIAGFIR
jgi:quinol monooxygenase YgiN